jgi:hypothetical protein
MTQIQYRSTTVTGDPTVAVTSVLHPTGPAAPTGDTVMYVLGGYTWLKRLKKKKTQSALSK